MTDHSVAMREDWLQVRMALLAGEQGTRAPRRTQRQAARPALGANRQVVSSDPANPGELAQRCRRRCLSLVQSDLLRRSSQPASLGAAVSSAAEASEAKQHQSPSRRFRDRAERIDADRLFRDRADRQIV
jgi:hypothetical protein